MFRRKAMDGLLKWRSKREHRCLLVEGPRGIGKTTLIREFAKTYEHSVRFDMRGDEAARRIFDRTPDVDGLVDAMGILRPGSDISPGNTLIVLDEIQHCPRARCALKSFSEDGRYDVVAAGSFPGVPLRVDDRGDPAARIPIGYERRLRMHGMDFEEFLWAVGFDEAQTAAIRRSVRDREPLPMTVLDACQGLFDRFMAVGGLPEAVSAFVSGEGMERVSRIQRDAALAFEDDAVAYAPESYARRIPICFDSVPSQLTGVDKRFMWSRIGGDGSGPGTARRYEHALWWMADAGVVHLCHGLSVLEAPVCIGKQQSRFKVYMSDTGVLTGMLGPDALHAACSKDDSFGHGALTENIVAECLMRTGVEPHYYIDEGCPDGMGPDFVVGLGLETAAIVVGSWKTPSLSKTFGDDRIQRRIVFGRSNIHVDENGIEHYPLFAAAFIEDIAKPLPKMKLWGNN